MELGDGRDGVKVSVQYTPKLYQQSRRFRRAELTRAFERAADEIEGYGAKFNLDTISVSGQTVEVIVPTECFDSIADELRKEEYRIDLLVDRQVLE